MDEDNITQISKSEEKILNELQKNCRLNLDEIGKKCGCSRYKVGRFIKKLEENNTILGYTAIINPNKTNFKHYILLIKRTTQPLEDELIKKLPLLSGNDLVPGIKINLEDTLYVHGNFDWVMTFTALDISYAKDFCNKILKYYRNYVESIELLETIGPIRKNGFRISKSDKIIKIL
jgi:DNA-binding Lrp family transcriptional regulator